jgi:transcriptional regulator with XRE-family HTH domain
MNGKQAQALRKRLGLRQTEFWDLIGISQRAGSRYEKSQASIPRNIDLLLTLIHGTNRDAVELLVQLRARQQGLRRRQVLQALSRAESNLSGGAKKRLTASLTANMSDVKRAMRYISQGTFDKWAGCNVRVPGQRAKLFSIGQYGSMEQATAAAQRYRDRLLKAPKRPSARGDTDFQRG